ncbi:FimV/HubP family polar landmark protein [Frateuria aurantia]
MNRVVMWSVLIGLATMYMPASAMEFGQVTVRSGPNQPLLAEVQLRPERPGELEHAQISMASVDEFEHAGISVGNARLPVQFSVRDTRGHHYLLEISSTQPVTGPMLDLLVAISGPLGRSVYELPIVLNPTGRHPVAAAHTPAARPAAPGAAPAATAAAGAGSRSSTLPAPASSTAPTQDVVRAGQTLYAIAQQRRLPGVSLDQMLLAYQQVNPRAFYADNISALKQGAILRVPTRAEAGAISRVAAFQAVAQQNEAWHAGRPVRPSMLANAGAAAAPAVKPAAPSKGDRLALLAGHGKPSASQAHDLSQETLRATQQQAAELNSRIHDLEVMQQERERLIALKNQQIARLQQQLQAARAAHPQRTSPAPGGSSSADGGSLWREGLAGLAVLLLLGAYLWRRRRGGPVAEVPLVPVPGAPGTPDEDPEHELARLTEELQLHPEDTGLYLELASLYYARHDVAHFVANAEAMRTQVEDPTDPDWEYVAAMGRELLPAHPLFAAVPPAPGLHEAAEPELAAAPPAELAAAPAATQTSWAAPVEETPAPAASAEAPRTEVPRTLQDLAADAPLWTLPTAPLETEAAHQAAPGEPSQASEVAEDAASGTTYPDASEASPVPPAAVAVEAPETAPAAAPAPSSAVLEPTVEPLPETTAAPSYAHTDAVDTKLDLARAYLDMGVPVSARAMLEEVLSEGSQMQKDAARQLLDSLPPA